MKKIGLTLFALCIACSIFSSQLGNNKAADENFEKLYQKAVKLRESAQNDSASLYCSYLYSLYQDSLSRESKRHIALSCLLLSDLYSDMGKYTASFEMLVKGLDIVLNDQISDLYPEFYWKLGLYYSYAFNPNYEASINCYLKGYEMCQILKNRNKEIEYNLVLNLAHAYCETKSTENARMYYQTAVALSDNKDAYKQFKNSIIKGLIYRCEGNREMALTTIESCRLFINDNPMKNRDLVIYYKILYETYLAFQCWDKALFFLDQCYNLANKYKMDFITYQNFKAYSEIYEHNGDAEQAAAYRNRFLILYDMVFDNQVHNKIENKRVSLEKKEVNKVIDKLNKDKANYQSIIRKQNRYLLVALAAMVLVLAAVTGSFFFLYRKKKSNPAKEKYVNTISSDTKKKEILDNINRVMTETDEFCKNDFSLDKLASLINSNSLYVSQVINEVYGKNFSSFLNEHRIRKAIERLSDPENYSNYTIHAISESVGYKSDSAFIKAFKTITGCTPSEYQRNLRNKPETPA